jgi:hypothetical protein
MPYIALAMTFLNTIFFTNKFFSMRSFQKAWHGTAVPLKFLFYMIAISVIACKSVEQRNLLSNNTKGLFRDSIPPPFVGRDFFYFDESRKTYLAYDKNRTLIKDWTQTMSKHPGFTKLDIGDKIKEENSNTYLFQSYRVDSSRAGISKKLRKMSVKIPDSIVSKSYYLDVNFYYFGANIPHLVYHGQSEYLATCQKVRIADSATYHWLGKRIPDDYFIYTDKVLEIFRPDGSKLATLKNMGDFTPSYLLQISSDERFVLVGSIVNIGDDEGYMPEGDFTLYDLISNNRYIIPFIDPNTEEGRGELRYALYENSLFQMFYYDGGVINTYIIDPYNRLTYFRHYPYPASEEVYKNGTYQAPDLTYDKLKNNKLYLKKVF